MSGALLGMVAALAADSPEIVSAVTAMTQHEQTVGAGIVIGSNVFNLAALLGLGAVVAGRISLHRRVVILAGLVALCVAIVCLDVIWGVLAPSVGLVIVLAVMATYVSILILGEVGFRGVPIPDPWRSWLCSAVAEEDEEVGPAVHQPDEKPAGTLAVGFSLVAVVGASIAMERAASRLGAHYGLPEIIVGGLMLAAVTSLPNAVTAVYLAARNQGSAVLSTALNSNALNVLIGFLLPATLVGVPARSGHGPYVAAWYVATTIVAVLYAYAARGIDRRFGALIIVAYGAFVISLVAIA
jgi:cation:H+ antiporter